MIMYDQERVKAINFASEKGLHLGLELLRELGKITFEEESEIRDNYHCVLIQGNVLTSWVRKILCLEEDKSMFQIIKKR